MPLVCIKYSICDLIGDVISCCVWSCDMGKVSVWQNHDWNQKKRENGNKRIFT